MTDTTTASRTYAIDPSHSSAHFSIRHLMISKVRGAFKTLAGTISLPASGAIPSAVSITIDAASIDTGEAQRDGHLRSADFFDVENFPKLGFEGTHVVAIDADSFDVTGRLTIHGVEKEITIRVNVAGQGKDPWGNDRIAYEAAFKIERKDYGLTFNQALEAGGIAIGETVDIQLDVETVPRAS